MKLWVSNIIRLIKSSYLPYNTVSTEHRNDLEPHWHESRELFVQLLSLSQTLLLGSLLGNLAVVVRLCWARGRNMWGNLGLDSLDEARALLLAVVDGLRKEVHLATESTGAEEEMKEALPSLPEW